jgi:hypothetical protein
MKQISAVFAVTLLTAQVASATGFWDQGMVLGKARTEYPSGEGVGHNIGLLYAEPTPEGCLFRATGNSFGCPGRNNVGTLWQGGIQVAAYCRGSSTLVGDSWQGCLQYGANNYYTLNAPGSSYWVISANSEPSFDQCNSGPPNLSFPITNNLGSGMYKVWTENVGTGTSKRMHMLMDMGNHDWQCAIESSPSHNHFTIPFLAVGAHVGRGQPTALQQMNTTSPHANRVTFKTRVFAYTPFSCKAGTSPDACNAAQTGVKAGFFMEATWNGIPHMVQVELFDGGYFSTSPTAQHGDWNWPVFDSMYFPGADLAEVNISALSQLCSINLPATTTSYTTYTVYATDVFKCVSDIGLFHDHMPAGTNVSLNGFHWYQESVGTAGSFWWTVEATSIL